MTNLFTFPLTEEEIQAAEEAVCDMDMLLDYIVHTKRYAPNAFPAGLFDSVKAIRDSISKHADLDFWTKKNTKWLPSPKPKTTLY